MKRTLCLLTLPALLLLSACPVDDDDVAVDDDDLFDDDDTGPDDDDSGPDDDDSVSDDDDTGQDDDDSVLDDDDSAVDDDDSAVDDDDSVTDDDDSSTDDDDSAVDDDDSAAGDDDDSASTGSLQLGDVCVEDNECESGVCWDFYDYDPYCGGAVCSITCVITQDCIDAFTVAGAADPNASGCGGDFRCTPIGTGFGAFWCS